MIIETNNLKRTSDDKKQIADSHKYKIRAKTLEGQILTYKNVVSYEIKDGFVHFIDAKTNKPKAYPSPSVEIEPMEGDHIA